MAGRGTAPSGFIYGDFVARILIVALLLALGYLLWRAADILLLLFAASLLAVLFRRASWNLHSATRLPQPAALAIVVTGVLAILSLVIWQFGSQIAVQFSKLAQTFPDAFERLGEWLRTDPLGQFVHDQLQRAREGIMEVLPTVGRGFGMTLGAVANLVLVFFVALYLAAQPRHYARGLLELAPPRHRPRIARAAETLGEALWLWVRGKLATMAAVGVLTTGGLLILDVPSALALGLIAAIAELVPFVGPILAAIPAVLIVAIDDPGRALYVVALYVIVQQLESYVILPLFQRRAVSLPPVLTIVSLVVFATMFGPLGVLLAEPLAVAGLVLVKMLYVEDTLGERTEVPGRDRGS